MTKPFKTYNGGKAGNGTYQQIINHIPKCDVFIDAFVGGGGILFNLKLPELTVINDVDRSIIRKYISVYHTVRNDEEVPRSVIIRNDDYAGIIDEFNDDCRKVFFYFDPPYLKQTRKSQKDLYNYEWNENDHKKFLSMAIIVKHDVMISHYPCDLYNTTLKDWNTHDFESQTRNGKAVERIYMNYKKPFVLQDFRYLGVNFRDRQRIKRKTNRFIKKLEAMPEEERTGILSAVIAKYNCAAVQLITTM